jgi:aryl-alcohol dehydrogenase-like predicted oxidoreductase
MSDKVKLIFGVPYPWSEEDKKGYLEVLKEYDVRVLDTGYSYPGSEKFIGDAGLAAHFTIHTKAKGWVPGVQSHEQILEYAAQSLENLKVDSVGLDIFNAQHTSNAPVTFNAFHQH